MRHIGMTIFSVIILGVTAGCGDDSTTAGTSGTGVTKVVTISGQVAVSDADFQLATNTSNAIVDFPSVRPMFQTVATSTLPNATVTLVKVKADGTEEAVSGVTATTDATGKYTLEGVSTVTTGTGAFDDFYYEVKATSGSVVVTGPAAPTATSTVNLSPETKLAAKMLSEAAQIPGSDTSVLPRAKIIDQVRDVVKEDVAGLSKSIVMPSSRTLEDADMNTTAIAVAAGGGNSEKILRTFEAEKEYQKVSKTGAQVSVASPYIERVLKQACNYNANFNLPNTARNTLAQAFVTDKKVTVSKLVEAYNDNNGADPDVAVSNVVDSTKTTLQNLEKQISDKTTIATDAQPLLLTKRELEASAFKHTSELEMDQAVSMVQTIFSQDCQPGNFDMIGFASDITETDALATATFVDAQVFHDSTGACQNSGHLRLSAEVYSPNGIAVSSVSVSASGLSIKKSQLDRVGMNGNYSRWVLSAQDSDATCVIFGQTYDYTLVATLANTSTVSANISRLHVSVPEAKIKFAVNGDTISGNMTSPTQTNAKRPIFEWSPAPGDASKAIKNPPTGSQLKFTFELSYIDKTDQQVGPLNQCAVGGSGQKLMDRNYFISDVDCDVQKCATASGRSVSNVVCRTNVQTFLVDENDRLLGQAAGNFAFYCVEGDPGC